MSPRSNDANQSSSSKQKKKNNSSTNNSNDGGPASSPAVSTLDSPSPTPDLIADSEPVETQSQPSLLSAPALALGHDDGAPPSASASAAPRVFVASTLKPVSAIESVTSTISAISQHANRGISNLIAAHSNTNNPLSPSAAHATPLRSDGSVSPIYDAFHNAGSSPDPSHIDAALHSAQHSHRAAAPRLLWSRWDRLPIRSSSAKSSPLLISYFDDGSLQALLVQHRTISELLFLPSAADTLLDRSGSGSGSGSASPASTATLLTAFIRPPTADMNDIKLLLVVQEPDHVPCLLVYSLITHHVQASVQLELPSRPPPTVSSQFDQRRDLVWPKVQIQCNQHFVVLSFAAPAAIHVLSTTSLQYVRPPILDVSSVSTDRAPPISLSHRLLAFGCSASEHLSPICSDTRKTSGAAHRDPSRPSTATHTVASDRVGEMRDNLFDTSAHVGDAARRFRGGVVNGVRTLGEWGSSYWPQAASPPDANTFSPPQPSLLSQSAPHAPANLPRHASSASSSPMLLADDGARSAKRLSTGGAAAVDVDAGRGSSSLQSACVRVVDLRSDARTICTFAPSYHAVTLVSFSPCGRMLLTADALGHAFHVFELPLSGTFGIPATPSSMPAVLHRYKLMRGITTADVVNAQWSPDSQWIAVGTHSGTVHVYAVNPFGGVPSIANHVQAKIRNPLALQPFGLSLSSLARSARPSLPQHLSQEVALRPSSRTGKDFDASNPTDSQITHPPPSFMLLNSTSRASRHDADSSLPFELLTVDTRSVSVTLHAIRCWSTQAQVHGLGKTSEEGVDSTHRLDAATSPRTSGLSQMMRKAGQGILHQQSAPRLHADCVRVATWEHLAPQAGAVTELNVATLADSSATSRLLLRSQDSLAKPFESVAKAEIETYSQSPAMLPSSIFLSRQTFFHARMRNVKAASALTPEAASLRSIQRRGSRPIQVRRTARIVSREPSAEESSSFDDSLAGALNQTSFSPEQLRPRSASAHIPSFPQGQRARSAGWTTGSSIPIRIVAGGLGGIYRAGKELGRGVDMARRRTGATPGSAAAQGGPDPLSRNTASISFDGEEDVDLLGEDLDSDRSRRHRFRIDGSERNAESGSNRSDLSMLSALRNDQPLRGSQPSSAETPSTRFSEAEDAAADPDECDWDAIEASRSPTAPAAPLFDVMDAGLGGVGKVDQSNGSSSADDDFTMGVFEVDSDDVTAEQPRPSLSTTRDATSKLISTKELVYALPAGGSTRSSLLSQSSGLTTTADSRTEAKGVRDSSASNSDGGDSGSQASAGSGMLCEGSKETHTGDSSPTALVTESNAVTTETVAAPVISTSGGGKKKKKKGGR
ncbi:hypothetical protein PHSY_002844 [Pseudozyma hubeiensis SY62]|uniref:BCAS3 WD40 domain-containing protein n=1 Tax=Pseudozyma hubeiensis (strain SY62) TaxID=1305764 RepID=R9P213_PSEHS|nr:hypothetical protein PHSY_002844 [Pseudozyma hubeiensis SY62]GAC95269.1 hypothetical protein PHSY_002844 [Pseudozyma hubeiensis SY62]